MSANETTILCRKCGAEGTHHCSMPGCPLPGIKAQSQITASNWQPKPIYCPRRHGIECDTPNACAGGADCRFGPDLNTRMNDRLSVSNTTDPRVEAVCHDEQMTMWASDFVGMLSLGDWLRDLSYDDGVELDRSIRRELRSIIGMAFNHPELQKPRWGWPQDFSKSEHDGT